MMSNYFTKTKKGSTNFFRANLIVFIFALAHAATCCFLHDTKIGDGLFLTVLTIAMLFCLIRFFGSPFDVFLGLAFLGCFAGFFIGTYFGEYFTAAKPHWGVFNNMIVTFLTTELLGFATILILGGKSKK